MAWHLKTLGRLRIWPCFQAAGRPLEVRAASSWQVSSYGRLQRSNGTVTWGCRHPSGYLIAYIQRVQWCVHRLVMHAFHGPPRNQLAWQVNHLDGNRSNNRLNNLQWVTPRQNLRHSYEHLSRRTGGPKLSVAVKCRAVSSKTWTGYSSMTRAAEALGISIQSVSASCSQGIVLKGYEIHKTAADMIEGEDWAAMIDPRTGRLIPERMVSSFGRIKGKSGRISSGHRRKEGYCVTSIRLGSEPRSRNVHIHQLVARAFLGLPPSPQHTQVNHQDGNKSNNAVSNLEYVTPAQNVSHSYRLTPTRTYSNVKPVESRPFGSCSAQWRWHSSVTGAARELGVHRRCIYHCLSGRSRQTGGYEFRCAPAWQALPGEEWRAVDIPALLEERSLRETAGGM